MLKMSSYCRDVWLYSTGRRSQNSQNIMLILSAEFNFLTCNAAVHCVIEPKCSPGNIVFRLTLSISQIAFRCCNCIDLRI